MDSTHALPPTRPPPPQVQLPSLTVGTLDSLMALSDDMDKVDMGVEQAVRKIERQRGAAPAAGGGLRSVLAGTRGRGRQAWTQN